MTASHLLFDKGLANKETRINGALTSRLFSGVTCEPSVRYVIGMRCLEHRVGLPAQLGPKSIFLACDPSTLSLSHLLNRIYYFVQRDQSIIAQELTAAGDSTCWINSSSST